MEITEKLKQANLRGRGGAGFPVWQKWRMVKDAVSRDGRKFIVCNVSEGEPAVFKDKYILKHWPEAVVGGIELAMQAVGALKAYFYLRHDYYDKFKGILARVIDNNQIEIFQEPCGYLGGEETTSLEAIQGTLDKKIRSTGGNICEPRIKPPFPPQMGLFGCPTLINNLETFYYAYKISKNEYDHHRFYCLSGDVKNPGVFEYPIEWPISRVLKESGNYPQEEFFVQAGGGASGTILLQNELNDPLNGAGAIIVHLKSKTDVQKLAKQWLDFFYRENCGKCAPCREGVYRLREIFKGEVDNAKAKDIVNLLAGASFCPFGKGAANALNSLIEKFQL